MSDNLPQRAFRKVRDNNVSNDDVSSNPTPISPSGVEFAPSPASVESIVPKTEKETSPETPQTVQEPLKEEVEENIQGQPQPPSQKVEEPKIVDQTTEEPEQPASLETDQKLTAEADEEEEEFIEGVEKIHSIR